LKSSDASESPALESSGELVRPRRLDLLCGLKVVQLGSGLAGSAAGHALWELGADVAVVDTDPLGVLGGDERPGNWSAD
jgi:hypothetical protein